MLQPLVQSGQGAHKYTTSHAREERAVKMERQKKSERCQVNKCSSYKYLRDKEMVGTVLVHHLPREMRTSSPSA